MTLRPRWLAVLVVTASLLGLAACGSSGAAPPPAAEQQLGWLHTEGGRLLSEDGTERRIRAVSWFGLETQTCAPHGLDTVGVDAVLSSIASMGFNTVRLPFSTACLHATRSTGVDPTLSPDLADAGPQRVMDLVVQRAAAHHLSVLLDRHRISSSEQSDLWYDGSTPEARWIDDWTVLARRYADDPTVIGADLHNEPHGAVCWGCGEPTRDWAAAATRAGNAILAVNPRWLIVVEGVEHQTAGESTWWGGGLADVRQHPILLEQPDRVVYSPHAYPPSIFDQPQFSEAGYPDNLPAYWDRTWGYLQTENLAPVLLGEFGSKLATKRDRAWLDTMVAYLNATRASFGYWSYNPDSSDTGGLVSRDWTSPERAKLAALAPLFAELAPAPAGTQAPSATSAPTLPAGQSEVPSEVPSATASTSPSDSVSPTDSVSPSDSPSATNSPSEPGSPTGPTVTPSDLPSTSLAPSTSSPGPGTLAAKWQGQSSWAEGYAVNLVLSASGAPTSAWRVSWPDARATAIQNSWGVDCVLSRGEIVCQGKDWGAWIAAGASVTVGVQVTSTGGAPDDPPLATTRIR